MGLTVAGDNHMGLAMLQKTDGLKSPHTASKPYQKPTLVKGLVLMSVTAIPTVSGSVPTCWVARAAFGVNDIRWMIFREWLLHDAPLWFRNLYTHHGEFVGTWLTGRAFARRAVRTLMMPAVNRKIRG
jgi:hypothetical protein